MGQRCTHLPTEINVGGLWLTAKCWQWLELFGWGAAHSVSSHPNCLAVVSLVNFPNLHSAAPSIIITAIVCSITGPATEISRLMLISVCATLKQS